MEIVKYSLSGGQDFSYSFIGRLSVWWGWPIDVDILFPTPFSSFTYFIMQGFPHIIKLFMSLNDGQLSHGGSIAAKHPDVRMERP